MANKLIISFEEYTKIVEKLAIQIHNNYKPKYIKIATRSKQINELQSLAKSSDKVILASDEDREGEAIAWHLCQVLRLDVNTTDRIVFHDHDRGREERSCPL